MNIKEIAKQIEKKKALEKEIYKRFLNQHNKLAAILPFSPEDIKDMAFQIGNFLLSSRYVAEIPYGGQWTYRFIIEPYSKSCGQGTCEIGYIEDLEPVIAELTKEFEK
ncbi:MAG: hypothetical protein P8016_17410 [Sedimentisphaerales bacterium]